MRRPLTGATADRLVALGRLRRVYLDYGGFSPVDPRVLAVMRPFLEGWVGNPSAQHMVGAEARESLSAARAKVGRLVGGRPEGVLFTSGATEANNLAVRGVALRSAGRHLVTTSIEHPSVLAACRDLQKAGFEVTYVPVDGEGRVSPDDVAAAIRSDTGLVSIGAANAEVGTVQDWRGLARVTRGCGVPFHVDGVGVVGRLALAVEADGIDLLTMSSNDLHGPPGVGALWIRPGLRVTPLLVGGSQEGGLRAGTENLAGLAGLGVAADLAAREGLADASRLSRLRDRLLGDRDPGFASGRLRLLGPRRDRLPHHLSLAVAGVKSDSLVLGLDLAGISASTGSPCTAATGEVSPVLRAMGVSPGEAAGMLVLTLGRWTTEEDVEQVAEVLPPLVARLRAVAGT